MKSFKKAYSLYIMDLKNTFTASTEFIKILKKLQTHNFLVHYNVQWSKPPNYSTKNTSSLIQAPAKLNIAAANSNKLLVIF